MSKLLDGLLEHSVWLRSNMPPQAVVEAAQTFIIDTLAVGIAGAAAPLTPVIREVASCWSADGNAPILGPGGHLTHATTAAFVNGFQIHCQEFDCVHEGAVVHPMATIFSGLSADCSSYRTPVSGGDFIKALALAVDTAALLGIAAKSAIQFFRPATAGIFGTTMGVAFLRGFDRTQTLDAMGYALSFASGTMQAHVEGKPALPVQIGHAARGALMACDLAERGIPSAHDSLEGPYGYLSLFEKKADTAGLADTLGNDWRLTEVSHKPFPTGRATQGGIVLMQELHAQDLRHQDIKSITLLAPPLINQLVGRPIINDMTANYARLCFPYLAAMVLRDGTVNLDAFGAQSLSDPDIRQVAEKIRVETNDIQDPASFTPQHLNVTMNDGRSHTLTTDHLYGSPAAPFDMSAQEEKVQHCIEFGYRSAQPQRIAKLWSLIDQLDQLDDITRITRIAAGLEEQ